MQVVKLPESANPALGLRFALQIGDKCDKTLTIRETGRWKCQHFPGVGGFTTKPCGSCRILASGLPQTLTLP